jgi:hypothetical protein
MRELPALRCRRLGVKPLSRALIFAMLLIVASGELAKAQDQSLPKPTQQVILTLTGNIDRTNSDSGARFDRPMLEALGLQALRTSTAWTEGVVEFEGVPALRVMEAVGARGETVIASALDNYEAEIPISDLERYPVLFCIEDGWTGAPGRSSADLDRLPAGRFPGPAERSRRFALGMAAQPTDGEMTPSKAHSAVETAA